MIDPNLLPKVIDGPSMTITFTKLYLFALSTVAGFIMWVAGTTYVQVQDTRESAIRSEQRLDTIEVRLNRMDDRLSNIEQTLMRAPWALPR